MRFISTVDRIEKDHILYSNGRTRLKRMMVLGGGINNWKRLVICAGCVMNFVQNETWQDETCLV